MNKETKLGIIGGDLRSLICAGGLSERGFESAVYGFSRYGGDFGSVTRASDLESVINKSKAIILPIPISPEGKNLNAPFHCGDISLDGLFSMLCPGELVLGGHICDKAKTAAEKYSLRLIDYGERDEFKISNAVPTAEGAIAIAINETPITLCGAKCLVLGYGRIGRVLSESLKCLGATVYAAARKYSDFAWIKSAGLIPIHINDIVKTAPHCDIIFNTIPKLIIGKPLLKLITKNTLIIDLASKPGGVDFDSAKQLGLNVIWALSLPGKTAPVTSGNIMCESISNILSEEGIL